MEKLKGIFQSKKRYALLGGVGAGLLNGLLGAAGGIVCVPMLKKAGLETKQAHATTVAVILPVCVISAILYVLYNDFSIGSALVYLPTGVVGAFLGGLLMPKIPTKLLRRIFGALLLFAGVRSLFF